MSGVVGVCCAELARFSAFSECLANLEKPEGTLVYYRMGMDVALNRKAVVYYALENDVDWVWFVDDDMLFGPDHLLRLLGHDLPVVASLYLNRNPPYYAMAFAATADVEGKRGWKHVTLKGAPPEGLAPVVAAGTGGMLIKTEVFRAIPYDTWFLHEEGTEDLPFCHRIIEAGYGIYLDMGSTMGHISTYAVWPTYTDRWKAGVAMTEKHMLLLEMEES